MCPAVRPPVKPMLAKLRTDVPRGEGWIYDPKWDGFRAIVFRDSGELSIASRRNRPLGRYFPEVEEALREALPPKCVVDGEIILPTPDGLDFDSLQLRLHPAASRVELLAEQTPCSFVAFDLLSLGDDDLRSTPLHGRLAALDIALDAHRPHEPSEPATAPGPCVWLTPRTTDADEAERWFDELERVKLDGIIAKRADLPYSEGERVMAKIKHRRTADCIVAGYRVHKDGKSVGSLLLGLYDDEGQLHYIGHTSSFKAAERRELLELLQPLVDESAFEGRGGPGGSTPGLRRADPWSGRGPGGPSRWRPEAETEFVPLRPVLVCEVSYDYMQGDHRFRHAATFLRWRDDKDPEACTFEQVRNA